VGLSCPSEILHVSQRTNDHTAEVPRLISTTERKPGDNVTFSCQSSNDHRFSQWYKQSPGKMIQTMATGVYGKMTATKTFSNTRFQFRRENNEMSLTIHSVKKEDEAVYFCQSGTEFLLTFHNGFLLVVKDCNQQTSVYVEQTPDAAAVQPGDTASLQCSLFSAKSETRPRCPGENFVHWFKSGSGSSYPSIIYTARNSTDNATKRSCVYHLSKTVEDASDFGTYYCAVAICGEILLGGGSKLETSMYLHSVLNFVLVLGGLLGCCVIVIIGLIFYITGRRVSDSAEGWHSIFYQHY
uniref:Ig-like domain-containing protein n=1 Tax=Poecilia latipinna TaxID=48699 RepID=A0A3B3THM8_9TELE